MDTEQFKDALQQCMEDTADAATRNTVVRAARSSQELRRILAQSYAFDAMLKGVRHEADSFVATALESITHPHKQEALVKRFSRTVRRHKTRGRRLLWAPALAAAASLLAALGIWLWHSNLRGPQLAGQVIAIQGEANAWVLRGKERIPMQSQSSLYFGDIVFLGETGEIAIETENGAVRTRLQNASRFELVNPNQYALSFGRAQVSVSPDRSSVRPLRFASPMAEADVVGTQFTMMASASHTRLRVIEGHVRFRDVRHNVSVPVAAGECAMAHQDRDELFLAAYEPGLTVDGDILFLDDFAEGIGRWKPVLLKDNGDVLPYPDSLPPLAIWKQIEKDGAQAGIMEISSPGRVADGVPTMLPRGFELPRNFAFEADIFLFQGATVTVVPGTVVPGQGHAMDISSDFFIGDSAMNRLIRIKRWSVFRVEANDAPKASDSRELGAWLFYSIDGHLIRRNKITGSFRIFPAIQALQGRALIHRVVVRELLTFD